ncbi:hypothetical protein PHLCEN_2v6044 [Hermanssonia centrifuga]|uniref:Uncharacterized protein n=1 Tax=Hermanssonia centrifuga TaxID=98765 RepID=A0A2R6P1A0_9APHY|nr:hypothetical protein PHLCEN_2v6044 [Hermanssonia centrifuga]
MGGIHSRGDMDFDIFGDVFLKSVYVVCILITLFQLQSKVLTFALPRVIIYSAAFQLEGIYQLTRHIDEWIDGLDHGIGVTYVDAHGSKGIIRWECGGEGRRLRLGGIEKTACLLKPSQVKLSHSGGGVQ